jgi:hypothetical protein
MNICPPQLSIFRRLPWTSSKILPLNSRPECIPCTRQHTSGKLLHDSLLAPVHYFRNGPSNILPKDILPNGHFADGHFADGRFAERTFCWTDILPNGQLVENRDIFWTFFLKKSFAYTVKVSVIKVIVNLMTQTLIVK